MVLFLSHSLTARSDMVMIILSSKVEVALSYVNENDSKHLDLHSP